MTDSEKPPESPPLTEEGVSEGVFDGETMAQMLAAVRQVMPFGKYEGRPLLELPEPYVVWFKQSGFPRGKLGEQMALVYEIKLNGLEPLFRPLLTHDPVLEGQALQSQVVQSQVTSDPAPNTGGESVPESES